MKDVTFYGNKELLRMPKTAFLAASNIPPDKVLKCYDWAVRMAEEGQCVISGFSSHLERDVLHFLMKGHQPIIVVLAREMYKEIPADLQDLIEQDRLLIISTSSAARQSKATALARNKYICEQADRILFIGATPTSSLFPLSEAFVKKVIHI